MALPTPTLRTERLLLRPFADTDADDLWGLHSNAVVLRYWDSPPWSDRARVDRFLATCARMAAEGSGVRVAICRDASFLGWIGLHDWNPDFRSAKLGYVLGEAAWGHGYATEAAHALLRWAFDALPLHRIQAEVDTRNRASARVLEKLGFVHEGTLREDCVVDGDVSDSWVYGLLRREWEAGAPRGVPTFRRAHAADAPLLGEVAQEAYSPYLERMEGRRPGPMDDDYAALVTDAESWVAEVDGEVAGFLVLVGQADRMLLEGVAVRPAHQGLGVGRALLTLAEERTLDRGYDRIHLYTHVTMVENQRLYERIGYVETHRATEHGLTRVFYEKALA